MQLSMKHIHYIGLLFICIIALHFLANSLGIYDAQIESGFVWIDNVLHALTGLAFALLGFSLLGKTKFSKTLKLVFVLTFVLLTALVWEFMELAFFKLFHSYAMSLKIYSPSLQEATADVVSNLVGAVLVAAHHLKYQD